MFLKNAPQLSIYLNITKMPQQQSNCGPHLGFCAPLMACLYHSPTDFCFKYIDG